MIQRLVFLRNPDAKRKRGEGSGRSVDVRICNMVRGSGGRAAAGRTGTSRKEGAARLGVRRL